MTDLLPDCLAFAAPPISLDDEQVSAILAFLEQVVTPPAILQELVEELVTEEVIPMAQVTSSFEREGLRKGRREGRLEMVELMLDHKSGPLDEATATQVRALTDKQLVALYTAALDFSSRADLDRWLQGANAAG